MSSIRWIEEWGLYRTFLFAMALQTFALWFGRSLNSDIFGSNLIGPTVGEFLNSGAQVYLFNGLTKFSGLWFGYRERVFATALILAANFMGNCTTGWYLLNVPDPADPDDTVSNFLYYLRAFWLSLAIFNFVIFLVMAVAFRAAPSHIPSKSQQTRGTPFNFRSQMKELVEEKETIIYLVISGFALVYCFCSPYNFRYYAFDSLYPNDDTPSEQ